MKEKLPATIVGAIPHEMALEEIVHPGTTAVSSFEGEPVDFGSERVLGATSVDELFAEDTLEPARDFLGQPLIIHSVEWRSSEFEGEGIPIYAIVKATDRAGAVHTISCGARSVCLKLAKAGAQNWLPLTAQFIRREQTKSGYYPLDLVAASMDEVPF